ncbi:hypothetical protein N2152v2_000081 [Parachlorella kessleri]
MQGFRSTLSDAEVGDVIDNLLPGAGFLDTEMLGDCALVQMSVGLFSRLAEASPQEAEQLVDEGEDGAACIGSALRVLGRLVQAAADSPALRPEVGRPSLWCGLTLLKSLLTCRPGWVPEDLSAAAELALLPLKLMPHISLPSSILPAHGAAFLALDACQGANTDEELMFLRSGGRLFLLVDAMLTTDRLAGELQQLLDSRGIRGLIVTILELVQRLLRFCFLKPASPSPAGEQESDVPTGLPADALESAKAHQAEAVEALKGLLATLQLLTGRQTDMRVFVVDGGIGVMVDVFSAYYDGWDSLGARLLEEPIHRCLLVAADCLLAALQGKGCKVAKKVFMSSCGFERLLDMVDLLPLRRIGEAYATFGYKDFWEVQCACLAVLGEALVDCEAGWARFVAQRGVETVIQATRWNPGTHGDCKAPPDVLAAAKERGRAAGLEDMCGAVAAYALYVVGLACVACEDGGRLVDVTSLAELSKHLQLLPQEGGLHKQAGQGLQSKYVSRVPLSVGIVLCTRVLLTTGTTRHKEAFMRSLTELRGHLLSTAGPPDPFVPSTGRVVALDTCRMLMRERPVWREQLLKEGVHLAAGRALESGLLLLGAATTSLQGAQAARQQGGRPGSGRPDCLLNGADVGYSYAKDAEGDTDSYRACIQDALIRIISATSLLQELQQAGEAGRIAVLEVIDDTSLEAAALQAAPALREQDLLCQRAAAQLADVLAWAHKLLRKNGGKRLSVLRAEEAAEAAAAALLAEEEAAQRKAAAKAAKRRRQKASKQPAKQLAGEGGTEPEATSAGQQADMPLPEPHTLTPQEPNRYGSAVLAADENTACLAQGKDVGQPAVALSEASSLQEGECEAEDLSQPCEPGGRRAEQPGGSHSLPSHEQPGSSQQVAWSQAPSRNGKLRKPTKQCLQQEVPIASQQQAACGTAGDSPGGYALPAGPARLAGVEQAPPTAAPELAAGLSRAVSCVAPAPPTPTRKTAPTVQHATPADAATLAAAPPAAALLAAAPWTQSAGRAVLPGGDDHLVEYQALLDLVLPGIHIAEHNTQATPAERLAVSAEPSSGAALASNLGSSIDPQRSNAAPVQQPVCNPSALAALVVCRLTGQSLRDPVIAADGYTYEREAFAAWLRQGKQESPVTGQQLPRKAVRPIFALRELLLSPYTC